MADEVNQKENSPESPPGDQSPPEVGELGQSAVSEAGIVEPNVYGIISIAPCRQSDPR